MDRQMYFRGWGVLDYLEPTKYFEGPWHYVGSAEGEDNLSYDIVILDGHGWMDVRYTNV